MEVVFSLESSGLLCLVFFLFFFLVTWLPLLILINTVLSELFAQAVDGHIPAKKTTRKLFLSYPLTKVKRLT